MVGMPYATRCRYTDLPKFNLRVFVNDTYWDSTAGPIFFCTSVFFLFFFFIHVAVLSRSSSLRV